MHIKSEYTAQQADDRLSHKTKWHFIILKLITGAQTLRQNATLKADYGIAKAVHPNVFLRPALAECPPIIHPQSNVTKIVAQVPIAIGQVNPTETRPQL